MLTVDMLREASKLLAKQEPKEVVLVFSKAQVELFKKEGENVDEQNMRINGFKFVWQKPWDSICDK